MLVPGGGAAALAGGGGGFGGEREERRALPRGFRVRVEDNLEKIGSAWGAREAEQIILAGATAGDPWWGAREAGKKIASATVGGPWWGAREAGLMLPRWFMSKSQTSASMIRGHAQKLTKTRVSYGL